MKYSKNEEAVSPVIGVILMVVITVIIAAIMAAFAFGMGAPTKAPQASLKITSADSVGGNITMEHQGGDPIVLANTQFILTNADGTKTEETADEIPVGNADGIIQTGEGISLTSTSGTFTSGERITVTVVDIPTGQELGRSTISAI
jgi:flagellin-like protein